MANPGDYGNLEGAYVANIQKMINTGHLTADMSSGVSFQQRLGTPVGAAQAPVAKAPSFLGTVKNIGTSVLHAVEASPHVVGNALHSIFVEPIKKAGDGIANFATANMRLDALNKQIESTSQLSDNLVKSYRAGKMSKDAFNKEMDGINNDYKDINGQISEIQGQTNTKAVLDIATNVLTSVAMPLSMLTGIGEAGLLGEMGAEAAASLRGYMPTFMRYIAGTGPSVEEAVTGTVSRKLLQSTPEAKSMLRTTFSALLKNPTQVNITFSIPSQIYDEAAKGKWGEAAANSALLGLSAFTGGPLGTFQKYLSKAGGKLGERAYGTGGFIDEIGKYLKDSPVTYLENLQKTDPAKYRQALQAWRVFQDVNLSHFEGDVKGAVNWVAEWHNMHSNPLGNFTAEQLTNYWVDFKNTLQQVQQLAKDGKLSINGEKIASDMVSRVGIGKFGAEEKYSLINALKSLPDQASREMAVNEMINTGYGWAQNPNMREAILAAVQKEDFAKDILAINTGKAVKIAGDVKFPRNYFPIFLSPNAKGYDTKILESIDEIKSSTAVSDALDRSVAPKAIAGSVAGFFDTIGLSPKDQNATAYIAMRRNLADNLVSAGVDFSVVERGGLTNADHILQKLGNFEETKRSVFDLRQLKISEIQKALQIDESTAKKIRGSLINAYLSIPLQVRGIGNKVQDINTKFNPFQRGYSRIQGAARYAYNPFFASQEIIESETIGQALVGGKKLQLPGVNTIAALFGRDKKQLDDVVIQLDKAGLFGAQGGRGEFAGGGELSTISAHLRHNQRLTMAGMTQALAERQGVPVEQYIKENGQELSAMLRVVVQYPKKSGLNSPMATTLNLLAFPTRYNLKVTMLAARVIAKQEPLTQVLILNSLMRAHDWLNSNEGIAWKTRNAAALQVLSYFTPLGNLGQVANVLTGNLHAYNDFGSLGALPFGFFAQILSDEGIIHLNAPYVQQSTGQVLPEYIPTGDKARAATALQDFIMSLFTYPGARIGLESKNSVVKNFTDKIVQVNKSDTSQYRRVDPTLTAEQQRQATIAQQAAGTQANPATQAPPAASKANPMQIYAIPPPEQLRPLVQRPEHMSKSNPPTGAIRPRSAPAPKKKRVYVARPPQ